MQGILRIVIILVATLGLGFGGFAATQEIMIAQQKAARERQAAPAPASDNLHSLQQSGRDMQRALSDSDERFKYAMIFAGVGAAIGLAGSIGLFMWLDARKKRKQSAPVA